MGKTDSPGGYHNGDAVIDPRLAWSEGFANFFQAAAQGTSSYLDTAGFCNDSQETGSCSQNVYFRLGEDGTTTLYDRSTIAGEGGFRELSITRTLFKIVAAASTSYPYGAGIPFKEIWNVFTDSINGFHSSGKVFRSMHLLTSKLDQIISSSYSSNMASWTAVLANEKQEKTFAEYNTTFSEVALNSCATRAMTPVPDKTTCYGSTCPIYKMSNHLRSNDFYRLDVTKQDIDANATIQIVYFQCAAYPAGPAQPSGSGDTGCTVSTNVDLDLYLYKQGYTYFDDYKEKESGSQSTDIVKKSARSYASLESGSEGFGLGQLTPGTYLLNVKANTYNKGSAAVGETARYRVQKNFRLNPEGFMSTKLKMYRNRILQFSLVFLAMFGLGYTSADYLLLSSNSGNQSPSLTSLLFNAKMGKSLSFVNVQLEAPDIADNPNDETEIMGYITLLKSSNNIVKYQWLLPEGVQIVDGDIDGQLEGVYPEEPVEVSIIVRGYSNNEKKLVTLTAGTVIGDTPVSNVALISSRPEDSQEFIAKQKFDISNEDRIQKLEFSSESPQDLRSQEPKIQR